MRRHTSYSSKWIALALKLLSIELAQKLEADIIRTNNDSLNAPMLSINRKLPARPWSLLDGQRPDQCGLSLGKRPACDYN